MGCQMPLERGFLKALVCLFLALEMGKGSDSSRLWRGLPEAPEAFLWASEFVEVVRQGLSLGLVSAWV